MSDVSMVGQNDYIICVHAVANEAAANEATVRLGELLERERESDRADRR